MSPEISSQANKDPRLQAILDKYGHVLVLNHQNTPQSLTEAVDECPPFVYALLAAESPEQLQQIIEAMKAPE